MATSGIGKALLQEFEARFEKTSTVFYTFPGWLAGGRRVETSFGEAHDMLEAGRKLILPADSALTRTIFAWLPILVVLGLFLPTILQAVFGNGWWVAGNLRALGVVAAALLLLWRFARIHWLWLRFNATVKAAWGTRPHVPAANQTLADKIRPFRTLVQTLLMLSLTGCAGWLVVLPYAGGNVGVRKTGLLGVFAVPTVVGLAVLWVALGLVGSVGRSGAGASVHKG